MAPAPLMPTACAPLLLVLPLPQEPKSTPTGPSERTAGGGADPASTTAPGGAGPTGPAPGMPCDTSTMLMMGLFLALMWFMVLRPEGKRRKETAAMLSALKKGDTVVTIGGMHGVVADVEDKTVALRCGELRMTFDRSAIARVLRDEPTKSDAKKG